jgi:NAD(P)-dependent dehydrogenase (short-subunit alcohol dehydrogenase family)
MNFDGQIVVVTGGAGGLGMGMLQAFGDLGATLVCMDRVPPKDPPHPAEFIQTDVESSASVENAFAELAKSVGPPDVLVNCAGIREIVGAMELPADEWDHVIAVDLSGTFYACKAAARLMIDHERHGSLIAISSVAGLVGIANRPAYSSAKHGLIGLMKVLAHELAPHQIRANVIAPGLIRTPLTEAYTGNPEFAKELALTIPQGSYGLPSDIAHGATFLACAESRYITGSVLTVDGGFMAERSFALEGPAGSSAYFDRAASTS